MPSGIHWSKPVSIQPATVLWPWLPPSPGIRSSSEKAPAALPEPGLWRSFSGIVVVSVHGGGVQPSIGCVLATVIGATHIADEIPSVRALAWAPTVTRSMPKTLLKKPGASWVIWTLIVSCAVIWLENEIPEAERTPPFWPAYWIASDCASEVDSGSACAPASAAASAVACRSRFAFHQLPTSIA